MAAGKVTARMHVVQVQFGGVKPRLHASFVREMEDSDGSKVSMGLCEVELDLDSDSSAMAPLIELAKAELKRVADDDKGDPRAKQFKELAIS